ncbi:MAG TPA: cytochrome C oxidase subunit IV family protein [Tepidisphaeraceae bacterium]|nr:cytochrome C oxidase subunit IV family protein [Tepidisphaeraceae bacterium]
MNTPQHITPVRTYVGILVVLGILLALTTWLGFVDLGQWLPGQWWNVAFAIAIAMFKAFLVVLFFMHVKYQSRLTWIFAAAGFIWLTILIGMTMNDYMTRNWPRGVNAKGEPTFLESQPPPPGAPAPAWAPPGPAAHS